MKPFHIKKDDIPCIKIDQLQYDPTGQKDYVPKSFREFYHHNNQYNHKPNNTSNIIYGQLEFMHTKTNIHNREINHSMDNPCY